MSKEDLQRQLVTKILQAVNVIQKAATHGSSANYIPLKLNEKQLQYCRDNGYVFIDENGEEIITGLPDDVIAKLMLL